MPGGEGGTLFINQATRQLINWKDRTKNDCKRSIGTLNSCPLLSLSSAAQSSSSWLVSVKWTRGFTSHSSRYSTARNAAKSRRNSLLPFQLCFPLSPEFPLAWISTARLFSATEQFIVKFYARITRVSVHYTVYRDLAVRRQKDGTCQIAMIEILEIANGNFLLEICLSSDRDCRKYDPEQIAL